MSYSPSHTRALSTSMAPETEASLFYSILPTAVQARIRRLPSIRRSASMYGFPTRRRSTPSTPSFSGTSTPVMGYNQAMVAIGREGLHRELAEYSVESASVGSEDEDSNPELISNTGRGRQSCRGLPTETESGIGWKFANQGFNLLNLAVEESTNLETSSTSQSKIPPFARQLYIHSLTYILRGLPGDLSVTEQLTIRSSLPSSISSPEHLASYQNQKPHTSRASSPPSLLHRTLATTIIQIFILFQLLLPYLKYFFGLAYAYDREHKITEKIALEGMDVVSSLRKGGTALASKFWDLGDGQVTETARWVLEGVAGGLHEGLSEGLVILNGKKNGQMG